MTGQAPITDIVSSVMAALQRHPAVRAVCLVGSRRRGAAGPLSDWDFAVDVDDFAAAARDLPALMAPLRPLAQQWDPLSRHGCYMLVLAGPAKVDLLFDVPHELAPPWTVSGETLQAIDDHFWDWLYWLASKDLAGKQDVVVHEFARMVHYLLRPLGVESTPETIAAAALLYTEARQAADQRCGVFVSRTLGDEVRFGLRLAGYDV